jgi:hypothetical protein
MQVLRYMLALPCKVGLHAWKSDVPVSERWIIRRVHDGNMRPGIQKGTQHCRYCPATRLAYRLTRGVEGVSHWHACTRHRERKIDILPPL